MTFPRVLTVFPVSRILLVLILAVASFPASADELPNPYPRAVFVGEQVLRWDFAAGGEDWRAVNQCELAAHDGLLTVRSSGNDPYLAAPAAAAGSEFIVRLRIKSQTDGAGQIFWSGTKHPGFAAERVAGFPMTHDGQWHEYDVRLAIDGDLTGLRLDPGSAPGEVQIDWIAVHRGGLHPLEIVAVEQTADEVNVRLKNHSDQTIQASVNGTSRSLTAHSELNVALAVPAGVAHQGDVRGVAFSPDGETVASAGRDSRVILWSVSSGRPLRVLEGHSEGVWSVAFEPRGAILASGGEIREYVTLWDVWLPKEGLLVTMADQSGGPALRIVP
jgi:hypothetical protein